MICTIGLRLTAYGYNYVLTSGKGNDSSVYDSRSHRQGFFHAAMSVMEVS